MILVDTSVWIDFFKRSSTFPKDILRELLVKGRVVTCRVVFAEIMSGKMDRETHKVVSRAFTAIPFCDPDWNEIRPWERMIAMATVCHEKTVPLPGLVDRMIALSAETRGVKVWTLDRKFQKFLTFNDLLADPVANQIH